MLQPPAQRDEQEQHCRRVKERHRRRGLHHDHASQHHAHAVHVGDGGGQDHQHVHVRGPMPQGGTGLDVEVTAADELDRGGEGKEQGVLQGEAGQQAAEVRVLVVLRAHVHHEVHHDDLHRKRYGIVTVLQTYSATRKISTMLWIHINVLRIRINLFI